MAKREIGIGTVKVARNQKAGSFIEIRSAQIEKFFQLESARLASGVQFEPVDETNGYKKIYLIHNISGLESTLGCMLRSNNGESITSGAYVFLRAQGLKEGLKIPITSPLTEGQAKALGENVGRCMQLLYISYMRNYSFEISVKANVEVVDTETNQIGVE